MSMHIIIVGHIFSNHFIEIFSHFLFGYDIFYTTRYMDNILYGIFKMYIQVIICSGLQRKCLNGAIPHSPCIEAGLIPPPEYWEYWDWL